MWRFEVGNTQAGQPSWWLYAGNNEMIVAPHTGDVVKRQKITRTITSIRRVLPDDGVVGAILSS